MNFYPEIEFCRHASCADEQASAQTPGGCPRMAEMLFGGGT